MTEEEFAKGYEAGGTKVPDVETAKDGSPVLRDAAPEHSGISASAFSEEVVAILSEPVDEERIYIRPDGLVYLPQNEYRRRLNRAFGPGGWGLMAQAVWIDEENNFVIFHGSLYAHGNFVSSAYGEHQYRDKKTNKGSFATSAESAKSDCLTRCCKDLGIATELWDGEFVERWRQKYAIEVWCNNENGGSGKKMWRLRASSPIDQWPWKEGGASVAKDSGTRGSAQPVAPTTTGDVWSMVLTFGKCRGKNLRAVFNEDFSYFQWLMDKWAPKPRQDGGLWPSDVDLRRALDAIAEEDAGRPTNHAISDQERDAVASVATQSDGVNDLPF